MTTLTHSFTPHGAAAQLFECRDPEVLIAGPVGTGKTRAVLEKLNLMALMNPGMRGLMIRKTLVSLTSSGTVEWEKEVIPSLLATGVVTFHGGSAREPAQYRYSNGSVVVVGGIDKASKIMSTQFDLICVLEATELTENDWESLTTRLRNGVVSFQQLIGDCNPDHEHHWLKLRCDRGQTTMLYSRLQDNPRFYDGTDWTEAGHEYLARLSALTGPRKRRLVDGEWSSAEGVIYEEWDSATHLIDPFPIPDDWTRWWSIDWGFTNPFVCQHWAEDPDGRLYLYREFYMTQQTTDVHAKEIMGVVAPGGEWIEPKPRAVICDHDPEAQSVFRRETMLPIRNAEKDVHSGIQSVMARLRDAGDGKPRLFIMRDCLVRRDPRLVERSLPTCTAEEIGGYVWDQRPDKPPKEEPLKENDHGMDALRYMVEFADKRKGMRRSGWA